MAETLTPLVYEGPIDTVRTNFGEVAVGGILHVPEDAAEGFVSGGLFREATAEEVQASYVHGQAGGQLPAELVGKGIGPEDLAELRGDESPVDVSDPSPASASVPSPAAAAGQPVAPKSKRQRKKPASKTTTTNPPADAAGSDDAGTAGEEG